MHIEIDQSGKVEKTSSLTVLAFANHTTRAVAIPGPVKQACIEALRKAGHSKQTFVFQIFAASVFLLIEEHLPRLEHITIDTEYLGRDGDIKGILLNAILKVRSDYTKQQISFRQIGKKSGAHYKAYGVYTGKQPADRILTAQEILAVLGK